MNYKIIFLYIRSIPQVTAKPELYPLVLSYNMDGNKITNGSYYVVQQFRNYLINPLTSNTEALGANLLDDTISDTNPAPPSYTLVPDNAVTVQNEVATSTSFVNNLTNQCAAIPEEKTNAQTDPPALISVIPRPQLIARFNSNVSLINTSGTEFIHNTALTCSMERWCSILLYSKVVLYRVSHS
uniref:Uncharacterized protein n=2 Tax=Cacopsylla melanoneura TaxID=428564 RepID=A0A8D8U2J1_9HEMI